MTTTKDSSSLTTLKRQAHGTTRRFVVRTTVHIFKECDATLEVLRGRFEYLSRQLRSLEEHTYVSAADEAMNGAAIVGRAQLALREVIALKEAIDVSLAADVDPHATK